MCYSADGTCVIAGGNSKYVCIYEISQKILLKKFTIRYSPRPVFVVGTAHAADSLDVRCSRNRSLDGVLNFLSTRGMTSAGPADSLDAEDSASDLEDRCACLLVLVAGLSLVRRKP